ncbi:hypothetical protein PG995_003092 [Apiospora arundinis]
MVSLIDHPPPPPCDGPDITGLDITGLDITGPVGLYVAEPESLLGDVPPLLEAGILMLTVLCVTTESHHEGEDGPDIDIDIELAGKDPFPGVLVTVTELAGRVTETDETTVTVGVPEDGGGGRTPYE